MVTINGTGPGSGYVVAPRLVLTSAHVVPEVGVTTSLFRPGKDVVYQAEVVWRGTPEGRDDAALLHVTDPAWQQPDGGNARWGRTVTHRSNIACEAVGAPDVMQRPGRAVELSHASGTLNPGDRHIGNRYVMKLDSQPPESDTDGSPWGGMSGAAMFCGDVLTGVIAVDAGGWSHSRLEAVPAWLLFRNPHFRSVLTSHFGAIEPTLEPVEWQDLIERPVAGNSPSGLLRADRQVVPFHGRDELLGELLAWCESDGFGTWLLHGPAGQGKTRLAYELAARLPERWTTLWLRADVQSDSLAALAQATVPLLVFVDYAETRTEQLAALLEVAKRHNTGTPFKLLLLARTDGDWWRDLRWSTAPAEELLDDAVTAALPPLQPDAGYWGEAYERAVHAFAGALPHLKDQQHHDWPTLARSLPRPRAVQSGLEHALTLHMLALADLLDAADPPSHDPVPSEMPKVEDRLQAHEDRYWKRIAEARGLWPSITMDTLRETFAAVFLMNASNQVQAHSLLRRVPGLSDQPNDRIGAVHAWAKAVYPAADGRPFGTLQPDRLAEHHVGQQLLSNPRLAHELVTNASEEQLIHLLTVYSRAANHPRCGDQLNAELTELCYVRAPLLSLPAMRAAVQTENPQPLVAALQRIVDTVDTLSGPTSILELLHGQLPHPSLTFAALALDMAQKLAKRRRDAAARNPGNLAKLAASLHDLAVRFGDLGRWEEASEAIREAITITRELADQAPNVHMRRLAMSLNGFSVSLGQQGRWEAALEPAREAIRIQRELGEAHSAELASSLNNVSNVLSELHRRDEAVEAISEAVAIRRELAATDPNAHLADLAMSLNNLSNALSDLRQWAEALSVVREAVGIYRDLVDKDPDAYLPDLAMSLDSFSNRLAGGGHPNDSIDANREAISLRRKLAAARPDAHLPALAISLHNLSAKLRGIGCEHGGVTALQEAVSIRRGLAATRIEAHGAALVADLHSLSADLWNLGHKEEGLAAAREAVEVWSKLADTDPDRHLPGLADGLGKLAVMLSGLGHVEESLAAWRKLVKIRRRLASTNPGAHLPGLAEALNNLSVGLSALGHNEEALTATYEAVDMYRQLAAARPDTYLRAFAASLNNLCVDLIALGHTEEAAAFAHEAAGTHTMLDNSDIQLTVQVTMASSLRDTTQEDIRSDNPGSDNRLA
ncbi:tetratricopeptide repeat protein [Streptomyces cinerochromogenes]|uniref:Tetratricopeptide repeat protein n=1 Tax=Streptomyces cinerochromogenes TaxID=66422 RepID=A0ABW7B517_9ACTN